MGSMWRSHNSKELRWKKWGQNKKEENEREEKQRMRCRE